jgi:hypothetical protein
MPEARQAARTGCAGAADIAANPKLLRCRFHRSFLPSFCCDFYSMGVKCAVPMVLKKQTLKTAA